MPAKKRLPQKPDGFTLVVRDNRIVQGRSSLTATQDKLLDYHIAAIRKDPKHKRAQLIRVEDFAALLPGKDGGQRKGWDDLPSRLRPFLKDCTTRGVTLRDEDKGTTTYLQWWSLAETYDDNPSEFLLELHERIAPYFIGDIDEYTKYHLKIIFAFQSTHSLTLYRLLKQYYNTNEKKRGFDIDDFRFHMDVIDKYERFNMLVKRVIDPAIKEINELSDILVEWEFKKKGKKFTGLTFYITDNPEYKSRAMKAKDNYKAGVFDVAPSTAADVLMAEGIHDLDAKTFGLAMDAAKVDAVDFVARVRKSYEKGAKAKPFGSYLFGALKRQFGTRKT